MVCGQVVVLRMVLTTGSLTAQCRAIVAIPQAVVLHRNHISSSNSCRVEQLPVVFLRPTSIFLERWHRPALALTWTVGWMDMVTLQWRSDLVHSRYRKESFPITSIVFVRGSLRLWPDEQGSGRRHTHKHCRCTGTTYRKKHSGWV